MAITEMKSESENTELTVAKIPATLMLIKVAFAFAAVLLITFYPVLESGFTNWDDPAYVTSNVEIRSLAPVNVGRIFTSFCCGHYHPLTLLSFAVEYRIFKLSPFFYHADNLLLHYVNCLLVLWLLFLITGNMPVSLFAALLFGIHPMHVESVAWVSGRKDVLFALPYLSSFISYIYYKKNDKQVYFLLSMILFVVSLLAKESAVTLPIILIAYDYLLLGEIKLKDKTVFIALSIVVGAIAIYSEKVSGAMAQSSPALAVQSFQNGVYSFFFYIEKLFFPYNLSCYYRLSVFSKVFLLKSAASTALLAFCLYFYKNKKEAAFALIFYLGNIVLFFQFIPVGYAVVCDRYTYLPYIGLMMVVGGGLYGMFERCVSFRRPILIFAGLGCVLLAFTAFERCKVWNNSFTLWNDALDKDPTSDRAFSNRATAYLDDGAYDMALADYNRAVRLNFNIAKAHFGLGNIYLYKKQYDNAAESFANAIKVDPSAPDSYLQLGLTYNLMNRDKEAIAEFILACKANSGYSQAYYALGNTYFKLIKYDSAVNSYTEALKIAPDNYQLNNNRGYAYYMQGKYIQALDDFNKAIQFNPDYSPAYKNRILVQNAIKKNKVAR